MIFGSTGNKEPHCETSLDGIWSRGYDFSNDFSGCQVPIFSYFLACLLFSPIFQVFTMYTETF